MKGERDKRLAGWWLQKRVVVVVVATLILFLRRGERAKIKRSFRRLKQRGARCACVDLFASAVAQVEQEVRDMGTNRL